MIERHNTICCITKREVRGENWYYITHTDHGAHTWHIDTGYKYSLPLTQQCHTCIVSNFTKRISKCIWNAFLSIQHILLFPQKSVHYFATLFVHFCRVLKYTLRKFFSGWNKCDFTHISVQSWRACTASAECATHFPFFSQSQYVQSFHYLSCRVSFLMIFQFVKGK